MKSDHGRRLARGAVIVLSADGAAIGFGVLLVVYLARALGASHFGLWTLASSVILFIEWSISSVFSRVTVKLVSDAEDHELVWRSLLRWQIGVALFVTLVTIELAPAVARALHEPRLAPLLRWLALEIPFFIYTQALRNLHIAAGRVSRRGAMNIVRGFGRLVFIAIAVQSGWSVRGAIAGSIAATILEIIVSSWGLGLRPTGLTVPVPAMWHYTMSTFVYTTSLRAMDRLDLFMLKAIGDADVSTVGAYGAAQSLGRAAMLIATAVSPLLLATTTRLHAERNVSEVRRIAEETFRLVVLSLPLTAIFAATAPSLIPSLFGKGFEMSGAAILLVLAGWPLVIIYLASSVLTAADRAGTAAAIAVLTIPIALAGYAAFIPRWHAAGAAAVTLFAFSVCAAVYVAAMDRRLSITWPWRAFAIASLLGAGSFGLVHRFGGTVVTDVLLGTIAGLLSLAALIATRTITADDLAAVRSLALNRHSAGTS